MATQTPSPPPFTLSELSVLLAGVCMSMCMCVCTRVCLCVCAGVCVCMWMVG